MQINMESGACLSHKNHVRSTRVWKHGFYPRVPQNSYPNPFACCYSRGAHFVGFRFIFLYSFLKIFLYNRIIRKLTLTNTQNQQANQDESLKIIQFVGNLQESR